MSRKRSFDGFGTNHPTPESLVDRLNCDERFFVQSNNTVMYCEGSKATKVGTIECVPYKEGGCSVRVLRVDTRTYSSEFKELATKGFLELRRYVLGSKQFYSKLYK